MKKKWNNFMKIEKKKWKNVVWIQEQYLGLLDCGYGIKKNTRVARGKSSAKWKAREWKRD